MNISFVLSEIRKKNLAFFKNLFVRYYEELVYYAYTFLKNKEDSEDVVQVAFAELWNNADKMDIKTSIKSYLYGMTRHRCLDRLRARNVIDTSHRLEFNGLYLPEENDPDELADDEVQELYEKILKIAKTTFPPQMYKIFKLKYLKNYEYKQIANTLGISVNTVKTQLKRAKEKIESSTAFPS